MTFTLINDVDKHANVDGQHPIWGPFTNATVFHTRAEAEAALARCEQQGRSTTGARVWEIPRNNW